jgi:hypothetical protein
VAERATAADRRARAERPQPGRDEVRPRRIDAAGPPAAARVLALQRSAGNTAVTSSLAISRKAAPKPKAPPKPASPAKAVDPRVPLLKQKLQKAAYIVGAHSNIIREAQADYVRENKGSAVAWVSEAMGGATLPDERVYDHVLVLVKAAQKALLEDDVKLAAEWIRLAERHHNESAKAWRAFIEAAIGGSGTAITTLEITRDVSFAVAGTIATGGLVGAAGVGATSVTALGIGAGVAGAGKVIEQTATQLSAVHLAKIKKQVDPFEILHEGGKSAVSSFVGGLVTGPFGDRIRPFLQDKFSGVIGLAIYMKLGPKALPIVYGHLEKVFLTAGASVIQTLLENAISTIQKMGKGELKSLAEGDLLENLWKSYFQNLGADYASQVAEVVTKQTAAGVGKEMALKTALNIELLKFLLKK